MLSNYFAYGSNLYFPRLQARVPSACGARLARLPGYRLCFHKIGGDGSAKANAHWVDDRGAMVLGVVYQIETAERPQLDACEGGYAVHEIEVDTAQGPLQAFTYLARPELLDDNLLPFHWYKAYVQQGAEQHGLSAAYLNAIQQQDSIADHDRARETQHFEILGLI